MLKTEFGNKIKDFIFLNKEIPLPGLGVFKLYHINQFLSKNESIIHPPQQKIRFENSSKGSYRNNKFKNYFVNKATLRDLEYQFQDTINNLLNFGKDEVQGLGKLSLDDKGSVSFISENLMDAQNKYLPIIDTLVFPTNESYQESSTKDDSARAMIHEPKELIQIEKSPIEKDTNPSRLLTNNSHKKQSQTILWTTVTAAFILALIFVVKTCDFNNETVIDNNNVMESSLVVPDTNGKVFSTPLSGTTSSEKISVVIGSFLDKRNAQKMVSNWSHSYDISIAKSNAHYRVVILSQNDAETLDMIKEEINSKAWILSTE